MIPAKITTHLEDGLDTDAAPYKGCPNNEADLTSFLKQVQDLEDALYDVLTKTNYKDGEGFVLDEIIGNIVGVRRFGLSDADFKIKIAAEVVILNSEGTIPDILKVIITVLNDDSFNITFDAQGYGGLEVHLSKTLTPTLCEMLISALRRAGEGSSRILLEYPYGLESNGFTVSGIAILDGAGTISSGSGVLTVLDASSLAPSGKLFIDSDLTPEILDYDYIDGNDVVLSTATAFSHESGDHVFEYSQDNGLQSMCLVDGAVVSGATVINCDPLVGNLIDHFPSNGSLLLGIDTVSEEVVTYTGISGTTFTGVSGVSGSHATGAHISAYGNSEIYEVKE